MVAAKWPAPPSGRSSRSTEVMTTWARPELRHRIGDAGGFVGGERQRLAGGDVAERAGAGAGVAHDHHGGVALAPALADVGAGGFLAHGDQAVGAHQRAGLVVDRMGGRLHPDPGGLALDGIVRPVRLLRVAFGAGAVVDDEAGGHGGRCGGGGEGRQAEGGAENRPRGSSCNHRWTLMDPDRMQHDHGRSQRPRFICVCRCSSVVCVFKWVWRRAIRDGASPRGVRSGSRRRS